MKYFLLGELTCSNDISSCCSDYGLAMYLYIIKQALNIIHLAVPIILIVMASYGFIRLMLDPDDKNKAKSRSLFNQFKMAVIIFLIPYIVNLVIGLLPDTFEISGCWQAADDAVTVMNETEEYNATTSKSEKKKVTVSEEDYKLNDTTSDDDEEDSGTVKGTKKGKKVVNYAKKFLGNPYVYGGTSLTNGTDCSGFTMRVYEHFGITIPRTSASQSTSGKKVASYSEAQAGDLFFYGDNGKVSHVAIYMGDGNVIHASSKKTGIKISTATYRTILAIRRVL